MSLLARDLGGVCCLFEPAGCLPFDKNDLQDYRCGTEYIVGQDSAFNAGFLFSVCNGFNFVILKAFFAAALKILSKRNIYSAMHTG